MSLSSVSVVTNALRLNLAKIFDTKNDRPRKDTVKKLINVNLNDNTYTLKIEGMMCPHCEATVKKCLEAFDEVQEVTASHENGTAVLTLSGELTHLDEMKQAIADKGYSVVGG